MSILNQQLAPPSDWQAFERLCFDLYGEVWGDPNAQMHGRSGQNQFGVDVFGHDQDGLFTGVQCKGKTVGYGSQLTERELRDEVEKAKHFSPSLDVFVVATTSPSDAKLQKVAGHITKRHRAAGLFDVHVVAWDTLRLLLQKHPEVARRHLGQVSGVTIQAAVERESAQTQKAIAEVLVHVKALQPAAIGLGSMPRPGAEEGGDAAEEALRTRIKDAADLSNGGSARAALALLDAIRKREWGAASARSRHRILYAIGFSHLALDETAEAVTYLRQAGAADPGKPWALSALAFADHLDGCNPQAFAHARAALDADPTLEQAAVALVHAADPGVPVADLRAIVPEGLREKPQVLIALAHSASLRGEWAEALRFSEDAYTKDPCDWRTGSSLAAELLRPVLAIQDIVLTKRIPDGLDAGFRRGLSLLRAAWAEIARNDFGARTPEIAANLAAALDVSGDEAAAEAVVDEGLRLRPDCAPLLLRKAMACAGRGDWPGVVRNLDHVCAERQEPEDQLLYARALLELGRLEDARGRAGRLRDEAGPTRARDGAAGIILEADLGLGAGPREVLEAWDAIPDALTVRVAALDVAKNDEELARRLLQDVDRILANASDDRDTAIAALILQRLGHASRAADLLAPLAPEDRDTPVLRTRLRCLLEADRRRDARELFERIAPPVRALPAYVDLGVQVYDRVGSLPKARALVRAHLDRHPDDLRVRLVWFSLSERMGDLGAAMAWLRAVPHSVAGAPDDLMALAHLVDRHLGDPKCLPIGYRALRGGFGDPRVHLGYAFGLFLLGRAVRTAALAADAVAADTAVVLAECGGEGRLVRVIETEPDPRIERNEIPPTDGLAVRLQGLSVGDEVALPDYLRGEVRYRIEEIRSKYVHAHLDVLGRYRERFPEAGGFGTIKIGGDDDPDRFGEVFRLARERGERLGGLEAQYKAGGLPLALLAVGGGCNVFDVWDDYRGRRDPHIVCALGSGPERDEAVRRVQAAEICVIDPLSLYAASALGIAETVRACVPRLAVAQSTLDLLAQVAAERRHEATGGKRGSLVWTGDGFRMVEVGPDALDQRAAWAEEALRFGRSCRVVPAEGRHPVDPAATEIFRALPDANLDSVLAASGTGGLLVCEDMHLRAVAEAASEAKGVWLQAVLRAGLLSEAITPERYADAVGKLVDAGHHFTSIGALELAHELRRHGWMPIGRVQRYFELLAAPGNDPESLAGVAAGFIRLAWRETGADHRFRAVIWQLLRALGQRHGDVRPVVEGWMAEFVDQFGDSGVRRTSKARLLGSSWLGSGCPSPWRRHAGVHHTTMFVDQTIKEYLSFRAAATGPASMDPVAWSFLPPAPDAAGDAAELDSGAAPERVGKRA